MDSLPNFLTHGAPLCARFARARSSAKTLRMYFSLEKYSWLQGQAKPYSAAKPAGIVAITQKLVEFSVLPFKLPNSLEIVFVNTRKTTNSSS